MSVLLSIIVPTKNRAIYCIDTIRTILSVLQPNSELIIHDDSDNDDLIRLVADIRDERLVFRYNETRTPLSFVANFSRALALARGTYLCVLGDDDAILPQIYEVIAWMEENNIDSVCPKQIIDYTWPNESLPDARTGKLSMPGFTGSVEWIDASKRLDELLENGIYLYQLYGLPRIYHGLIHRECMEAVKARSGHYFGGLTPDMYATISLATVVKNHVLLDFPFTIAGACPASATVASIKGQHSGALEDAPHLRHRGPYTWEPLIPEYYSVETIWAETALKALKEMGHPEKIVRFNQPYFLIRAILANRRFIPGMAIRKSISLRTDGGSLLLWYRLVWNMAKLTVQKIAHQITDNAGIGLPPPPAVYHNIWGLSASVDSSLALLEKQQLNVSFSSDKI